MSREWKPGDVAMLDMRGGRTASAVAIWTGAFWAWSDGTGPYEGVSHGHESIPARPVVVIDPENREQVMELLALFVGCVEESLTPNHPGGWSIEALTNALRSLIEPPRPEEPTGLGAVVEDADGLKWVQVVPRIGYFNWQSLDTEHRAAKWHGISAVRVLSEGVTP